MNPFSIAIHGGAGTIVKEDMTAELEAAYLKALQQALDAGYAILEKNGTAADAVVAATISLEDNSLFNAGKGSVITKKGEHEMDAAIMEGKMMSAGAIAGVKNVRNPVLLAKEVMINSRHVFLSGDGAREFAIKQGVKIEPDEYFFSQFRYDQWKAMRDSDTYALDHTQQGVDNLMKDKKFGTVGAVASDSFGNIAAATSTGGMTNKKFGRIGDSPVIGAGTYANNKTVAVSCTGHGEPFIKAVAAYDVSCLVEYKGLSIEQAMYEVVHKKLIALEGEGGMIGVDAQNNIAMLFNSAGMYRGMKKSTGEYALGIYKDMIK
ncbi:MAG: isoaspartyl peptidase/L-asparaginase [Rhizobacter sp.]|nr:isoaspartyl peptidase/L-asparaginase [Ferruginibacter sp.]